MPRLRLLAVPLFTALLLGACSDPSSDVPAGPSGSAPKGGLSAYMPPDSTSNFEITTLPFVQSLSFAPDLCNDAQDVFFVAHQDDDLLFMNPDIATAISQKHCVVTVFLTAGDNEYGTRQYGLDYQQYWRSREDGERDTYARMAGVPNAWTQQIYPFAGKAIRTSVLQGNPRVRLMFLRLRESSSSGVTMRALWETTDPTLAATALDNSNTFTRQEVLGVLTNVLTVSEAKYVHLQDTAPVVYGTRNEHPDHIAAGRFGDAADRAYAAPHVTVQHRDYNIGAEPYNVTTEQFDTKLGAFKTYAGYDPIICPPTGGVACVVPGGTGGFYVEWSWRQYFHVDVTQGGTLARLADGRLAAFVIGDRSSSPLKMVQTSPGAATWSAWEDLKGNYPAPPNVVGMADGRLVAFERSNDGRVMVKTELSSGGAWGNWVSLGGVVSSVPVAARQSGGALSVFVRGNDGQVYLKSQLAPNGEWGNWVGIGGPKFTSNPAVALDRSGRLVLFVRATDGAIYTVSQTAPNGGWGAWQSLGGSFGAGVHPVTGANQDGRLEVFVRGSDDKLYHRWQTPSGGWGGWSKLGDVQFSGSPAVTITPDGIIVATVRSVGGSVQSVRQGSPNGGWLDWTNLGGSFVALIGAMPDSAGRLTTLARGTDDLIYRRTQVDSTWTALRAP
ncbi:PIG-L family deacetylase [Deinococcus planocerae]|uniref:PIG-L family deacetylase n=1 Tax=Deinococcus planocerae TaxID=1737569 RepID=UPI000C7F3587|nr:PIG-L family deacetylase [Deinococcus planocerae]